MDERDKLYEALRRIATFPVNVAERDAVHLQELARRTLEEVNRERK